MTIESRLDFAARARFEGYELTMSRSGEAELHVDCSDRELESIRSLVADKGLEICSMFGSPVSNQYPITSPDGQVWTQGIQAECMLYIAHELGIDTLLLVPGRVDEGIPYRVAYDGDRDEHT